MSTEITVVRRAVEITTGGKTIAINKGWNYTVQYDEFTDSSGYTWRRGVRGSNWVLDVTLTALGFEGVQNTDWEQVDIITRV